MRLFSRSPLSMKALLLALLAALAAVLPAPAAASFGSTGFQFLEAVRERDGTKATQLLTEDVGTLIDTRDQSTRQTALHIVTERRDTTWMRFLLARRADANLADRAGTTPLLIATQIGYLEGARLLVESGARVNQANSRGETALHLAVQRRDLAMVRALIAAGADPERPDNITGQSPRDYASADNRAAAIVAALDARPATDPAQPRVAGPN